MPLILKDENNNFFCKESIGNQIHYHMQEILKLLKKDDKNAFKIVASNYEIIVFNDTLDSLFYNSNIRNKSLLYSFNDNDMCFTVNAGYCNVSDNNFKSWGHIGPKGPIGDPGPEGINNKNDELIELVEQEPEEIDLTGGNENGTEKTTSN